MVDIQLAKLRVYVLGLVFTLDYFCLSVKYYSFIIYVMTKVQFFYRRAHHFSSLYSLLLCNSWTSFILLYLTDCDHFDVLLWWFNQLCLPHMSRVALALSCDLSKQSDIQQKLPLLKTPRATLQWQNILIKMLLREITQAQTGYFTQQYFLLCPSADTIASFCPGFRVPWVVALLLWWVLCRDNGLNG